MVPSRMAKCLLLMVLLEDSQQFYDYRSDEDSFGCGSDSIRCSSSSDCIPHSDLCNDLKDCSGGEDEDSAWCALYKEARDYCDAAELLCDYQCMTLTDACISFCSSDLPVDVCTVINNGILTASAVEEEPEPVHTSSQIAPQIVNKELVSFMSAANCSLEKISASTNPTSGCPQLYSSTGNTCLAPLPFVVTWPDALIACQSIAGRLLEVESLDIFAEVIQFLVKADFSSNFWIGGFYDIEKGDWAWSSGPKMPRSTPYWTVKHSSTCVTRQSPALGALPGCFQYQQAPTSQGAGYCAALQFEYMYYISDEGCFQKKQPLCIRSKLQ